MAATGIPSLDHAPQVAAEWLNELAEDLQWPSHGRAYMLLHEVLHALRDLLSVAEVADLAAQFPVLIRGVFYTGWNPSGGAPFPATREAFVAHVAGRFDTEPLEDPEAAVVAVFDLLRRHVSEGEMDHIRQGLRGSLRDLMS